MQKQAGTPNVMRHPEWMRNTDWQRRDLERPYQFQRAFDTLEKLMQYECPDGIDRQRAYQHLKLARQLAEATVGIVKQPAAAPQKVAVSSAAGGS